MESGKFHCASTFSVTWSMEPHRSSPTDQIRTIQSAPQEIKWPCPGSIDTWYTMALCPLHSLSWIFVRIGSRTSGFVYCLIRAWRQALAATNSSTVTPSMRLGAKRSARNCDQVLYWMRIPLFLIFWIIPLRSHNFKWPYSSPIKRKVLAFFTSTVSS